MKEFIKKNFAVILAFTLPIVLIIVIALVTYLPAKSVSTEYNFIYTSCSDGGDYYISGCNNYLQQYYSVEDNKLVINSVSSTQDFVREGVVDINKNYTLRIFLHDTTANVSKEITLTEAEKLSLNSLLTSPDGVTVSSDWDRGADFFFIFDRGSFYGYYLTKDKSKSRLDLINDDNRYYYRENFKFIGWVLP